MYLQLDNVLYTFLLLFTSAVFWYFWKFVWPYRKFPSVLFDRKLLIAYLRGEYPTVKYFVKCSESHLFNVLTSSCKIFEKEGLCYAIHLVPLVPLVFVFNEEYTKILLNESAALYKPWPYKIFSEVVGNGLLLHGRNTWKKRRKMINPAFNVRMLKDYVSTFNRCARHAVGRFSMLVDQPTSGVLHIIKTTFLKAICEIVVGKEMNGVENERKFAKLDAIITELGYHTIYRVVRPWRFFKKFEFLYETGRRHQKDYEDLHNFMKYLIEEVTKDNILDTEDEFERRSLFHFLLRQHLNDPKSFTMENIYHEIKTMVIAGHDTTTHTMHWCLIMLSLHPEIQQKAYEEVEAVLGIEDRDINFDDLNKLIYLDSIIKETLRLYPAIPCFLRCLDHDVQCGKYKIPKSSVLVFVVHLLHRNADIYPNPDTFDPDRFHKKTLEHPWALVPFAEGIRSCIGKSFTMLEMKVFLVHILRNFKISLENKDKEIKIKWCVVLETGSTVTFLLTKR